MSDPMSQTTTPPNAPEVDAAEVVKMSVLHPRIKREQRDARILAMRGKGETLQAIGDELGLTRARVQQICADSKMPERDLLSWLEATAAYISTPLGMPALGKKISRVSATVADLIEDRDALLTREAALVAELEALKFRSTNRCVTLQDSSPLDERLQVYARQFGNETIFSRTGKTTDRSSEIE